MTAVKVCAAGLALALAACGSGRNSGPDADPRTLSLLDLVDAYEAGEISRATFRQELALRPGANIGGEFPATISENLLIKARGGEPYVMSGDVTVEAGSVLVINAGVEIVMANGVGLVVEGRLYTMGASDAPIAFRAEAMSRYREVALRSGPNQSISTIFDGGERDLVVEHGAGTRTRVEECTFERWSEVAVDFPNSSGLWITGSQFGTGTQPSEISGETIRARGSGFIQIENSHFGRRFGYSDVMDLQDCDGRADEWPIIIGNRFDGGEDDGVDLDGCSAYVVGNYFRDFRKRYNQSRLS